MIAIIDYGLGNLRSAQKGFEKAGFQAIVTDDPKVIDRAGGVVLPGVGAFKDCYEGLKSRGLVEVVQSAAASGRPFLGICVGMQLLFDYGEEGEGSEGLHILAGRVVRFPDLSAQRLKVPHMGWNALRVERSNALLGAGAAPYVYFVHSYFAQPEDPGVVLASSEHGVRFPAMVGRDNIYAVQFHPEKSQAAGIGLLRAFGGLVMKEAA